MEINKLLSKLHFKSEYSALSINTPVHLKEIFAKTGFVFDYQISDKFDFVMLFVHNKRELNDWLGIAINKYTADRVLWIAFPKGTSKLNQDINRDILWKLVEPAGYRPVTNIAIDEDWSALRFRPVNQKA